MQLDKSKFIKTLIIIIITSFISIVGTCIVVYVKIDDYAHNILKAEIKNEDDDSYQIARNLINVKRMVKGLYLGEIDKEKMREGALKGYIEALGDEYTQYFTAEEMGTFEQKSESKYAGVGLYLSVSKDINRIVVVKVIEDTPADKAGFKMGDILLSVDGEVYTADTYEDCLKALKGTVGSTVKCLVQRDNDIVSLEAERAEISISQVYGEIIDKDKALITIDSFSEDVAEDFKNQLDELKSQGAKSVIIDLRNNGGGVVDRALDIAKMFVKKDSTLITRVSKTKKEVQDKQDGDPIYDMNVVVLINENTASASEILTCILKETYGAKIIGHTSYGKGVIQSVITLPGGAGLKITTHEYFSPNHNTINHVGIEPDIVCDIIEGKSYIISAPHDKDNQLKQAIDLLNK